MNGKKFILSIGIFSSIYASQEPRTPFNSPRFKKTTHSHRASSVVNDDLTDNRTSSSETHWHVSNKQINYDGMQLIYSVPEVQLPIVPQLQLSVVPEESKSSSYAVTGNPVIIDTEEKEQIKAVKKECTKLKLAVLVGATTLVSSGITAMITYLNSGCSK